LFTIYITAAQYRTNIQNSFDFANFETKISMINNDKQTHFNQVKGVITEINRGEEFSNLTLILGHTNPRNINLCTKTYHFDEMIKRYAIGDKVVAQFYASSNYKNDRWYTTCNILSLAKDY
jgi:hypothetical protein